MKILVALSGGLDSAATVLLLKKNSLEHDCVEAIFFDMFGDHIAIENAKCVAQTVNVKLHIVNCAEEFKAIVLNYFFEQLKCGKTPSACAFCNPNFKFKKLFEFAQINGFDYIATGHYVRKIEHQNNFYICKGVDRIKDQTYFLWGLSQEVLSKVIFPLGNYTKSEIKTFLQDQGFAWVAQKKESMSLCFMSGGDYKNFLLNNINLTDGDVVEQNGALVGSHYGCQLYTIGQKRGFNIFNNGQYEVCGTDVKSNRIIVTDNRNDLYVNNFTVGHYSITDETEFFNSNKLSVIVRGLGRNPKGFCKATRNSKFLAIHLENPAWALASGQSAVFYIDDRVVGGGEII